MYYLIFKAYKFMLQKFSIKGEVLAADESTSVYIYFIGCCTYVIYVTYMTRLAIIPYRREKYIFEGTEYHCGPYYENDTIESEIKKLINKSVVTENLFLVLQNYVL